MQAEQARERLARRIDSSDDAIISKTLDGTIGAWNRGAEKVFGYSAGEIAGKPMLVLLPPELFNEEANILAGIASGESFEHFETVRVRKDGTNIDVSVTISPIRDGDGVVIGASTVARDITGRKRAEQALRDSEENLRLALDGARLGTWQWKLETDELEWVSAVVCPVRLAGRDKIQLCTILAPPFIPKTEPMSVKPCDVASQGKQNTTWNIGRFGRTERSAGSPPGGEFTRMQPAGMSTYVGHPLSGYNGPARRAGGAA